MSNEDMDVQGLIEWVTMATNENLAIGAFSQMQLEIIADGLERLKDDPAYKRNVSNAIDEVESLQIEHDWIIDPDGEAAYFAEFDH